MIPDYIVIILSWVLLILTIITLIVDIIVMRKTNKNVKKVFEQYKVLEDLGIIEKYGLNEEQANEIYKGNNHE